LFTLPLIVSVENKEAVNAPVLLMVNVPLPGQVPPHSDFSDTWFLGHGQVLRGTGSFPSGHAVAAFSLATIFADRYPKPRWHRWVAFGLAGFVSFSRLPLHAHYPSDLFAGAVLGYSIAHFVVLRPQ